MFYKLLQLIETTAQSLKKFDKSLVKSIKIKATNIVNQIFPFEMDKTNLINWLTLQLIKNPNHELNYCKDYIADQINNINFNNDQLTWEILKQNTDQWHNSLIDKRSIGRKGKIAPPILKFKDGWFWTQLGSSCEQEAASMGHCGNKFGKPTDRILSLRDPQNVPHLTFILNNHAIGESKGRFNEKPNKKYHKYIVELLKQPYIYIIMGGGYRPESNFELSDLTKKQQRNVLKVNPNIENHITYIVDNVSPENYAEFIRDNNLAYKILLHNSQSESQAGNYEYEYKNKKFIQTYYPKNNSNFVNSKIQRIVELAKESLSPIKKIQLEIEKNNDFSQKLLKQIEILLKEHSRRGYNRIQIDYNDLMTFMRFVKLNYPEKFKQLYQMINEKSNIVTYLIATDTPVDHYMYFDLSNSDLDNILDELEKNKLPIPDELTQQIQMRNDWSVNYAEPFSYTIDFLNSASEFLNAQNYTFKDVVKFDKLSPISYKQCKQIEKIIGKQNMIVLVMAAISVKIKYEPNILSGHHLIIKFLNTVIDKVNFSNEFYTMLAKEIINNNYSKNENILNIVQTLFKKNFLPEYKYMQFIKNKP